MGNIVNDRSGYVYAVQADNGLVKIGRTKNFRRRFKAFLKLPYALKPICAWRCEDAVEAEADKHWFWADCRKRGEWFEIPAYVLDVWKESHGDYIPKTNPEDFAPCENL